jgi:large subunit ribosomal protein L24
MKRIKTGDTVIVTTGKSKGHVGKIERVKDDKVIVQGANMIKKHVKPNPNANQPGGIIASESLLHVSNIAHYNPVSKRADKVGFKQVDMDGKIHKVRYFKSNNELVDLT